MPEMNTPTVVVAILTLWLVMGLGFLAKYVAVRKSGRTSYEAWISYEGLLFILSIVVPIIILIHTSVSG